MNIYPEHIYIYIYIYICTSIQIGRSRHRAARERERDGWRDRERETERDFSFPDTAALHAHPNDSRPIFFVRALQPTAGSKRQTCHAHGAFQNVVAVQGYLAHKHRGTYEYGGTWLIVQGYNAHGLPLNLVTTLTTQHETLKSKSKRQTWHAHGAIQNVVAVQGFLALGSYGGPRGEGCFLCSGVKWWP